MSVSWEIDETQISEILTETRQAKITLFSNRHTSLSGYIGKKLPQQWTLIGELPNLINKQPIMGNVNVNRHGKRHQSYTTEKVIGKDVNKAITISQ